MARSAAQRHFFLKSHCPRCKRHLFYVTTFETTGRVRRFLPPTDPAALSECPKCHGRWFYFEQPLRFRFTEPETSYRIAKTVPMILDNRLGTSPLIRECVIDEGWLQQFSITHEAVDTESIAVSLGLGKGSRLRVSAEQAVKERYAISERRFRHYIDKITIDVPPGILRKTLFIYKETVQRGRIMFDSDDPTPAGFAYEVVTDWNLDLTQEDSS